MAANKTNHAHQIISTMVQSINQAWAGHHIDDLQRVFHENMIMLAPGFQGRCTGGPACVAGYRRFADRAAIHRFHASDLNIGVYDATALARYRFAIEYDLKNRRRRDSGYDLFVFRRVRGTWHVVQRILVPLISSS